MRFKAVGFDMDGTVVHSRIDYVRLDAVVHDTLASLGVPPEELEGCADDREAVHAAADCLRRRGSDCGYAEVKRRIEQAAAAIELENLDAAEPFPGTAAALERIAASGRRIGLLSRGERAYVEAALEKCGLAGLFEAVVAIDDRPRSEGKPNPVAMERLAGMLGAEASEIVYVGDSLPDYLCAERAGAAFVGVCSGRMDRESWKDVSEGIRTIASVADLPGCIDAMERGPDRMDGARDEI